MGNFLRMGTLVLCIHDCADFWIEVGIITNLSVPLVVDIRNFKNDFCNVSNLENGFESFQMLDFTEVVYSDQ